MTGAKFTKIVITLSFPLLLSSCIAELFGVSGKGAIITENRTATNFHSIELLTSADVEVIKGDTFLVQVSDY